MTTKLGKNRVDFMSCARADSSDEKLAIVIEEITFSFYEITVIAVAAKTGIDALSCSTLIDLSAISTIVIEETAARLCREIIATTDAQNVALQQRLQTIGPFDGISSLSSLSLMWVISSDMCFIWSLHFWCALLLLHFSSLAYGAFELTFNFVTIARIFAMSSEHFLAGS